MRGVSSAWSGAAVRHACSTLPAAVTAIAASPLPSLPSLVADDAGTLYTLPPLSPRSDHPPPAAKPFFQHRSTVNALSALPHHGRAVSASDDESVVQWAWRPDSVAPVALHQHTAHGSYVVDAAVREADLLVASIGLDQRLVLASAALAPPVARLVLPEPPRAVAFFADPLPLLLLTFPASVSICDLRMPSVQPLWPPSESIERIWRGSSALDDVLRADERRPDAEDGLRVLSSVQAVGAAPPEHFDRFTGRYVTPPAPHAASLVAAVPLAGHVGLATLCRAAHLRLWRTDSASLLHALDAPPLTPAVRPAVAGHVIATCHGADVALHGERAPHMSEGVMVRLHASFAASALALAAPHGPLLVGNAGGQVRVVWPHAADGENEL